MDLLIILSTIAIVVEEVVKDSYLNRYTNFSTVS